MPNGRITFSEFLRTPSPQSPDAVIFVTAEVAEAPEKVSSIRYAGKAV